MRRLPNLFSFTVFTCASAMAVAADPVHAAVPPPAGEVREVCFVLDTTGSMSGLIEGAKRRIWGIVNELTVAETGKPRPRLRIGLVAYRDRGDDYITQVTDLNDDLDAIWLKLSALRAGGGGDGPESVNQALAEAVAKVTWSKDKTTMKTIFLVGDAPPHMDYANDVKYPVTCTQAVTNGIVINSLLCGADPTAIGIWQDIAKRSEGRYAGIPQDGGVKQQETPFDAAIGRLNSDLAATAIAYGDRKQRDEVSAKVAAQADAPVATSADRAENFARKRADAGADPSAAPVVSGKGELINDLITNKIDLDKVSAADLPPEFQGLKKEEIAARIAERQQRRIELGKQLDAQLTERAKWLREQAAAKPPAGKDGFDAQVSEMVKIQAARMNANPAAP